MSVGPEGEEEPLGGMMLPAVLNGSKTRVCYNGEGASGGEGEF